MIELFIFFLLSVSYSYVVLRANHYVLRELLKKILFRKERLGLYAILSIYFILLFYLFYLFMTNI